MNIPNFISMAAQGIFSFLGVINLLEDGTDSTKIVAQKGTSGAAHTYDATLRKYENEGFGVADTIQGPFNAVSAARDTSNITVGISGSYLHRIKLTAAVTVADLTITDFAGTVLTTIPSGTAAGYEEEINCQTGGGGFVIPLHASGVGTVTFIGIFS